MDECQDCPTRKALEQALRDARDAMSHLEQALRRQGCCDGRHHLRERRTTMTQFLVGWIRQLTTKEKPDGTKLGDLTTLVGKEGTGKFEVRGTTTGRIDSGYRKQQNIRIQSAAADITAKLIAADIIHSQRCDQVDEIVRDILFAAFGGTGLASSPQPITKSR